MKRLLRRCEYPGCWVRRQVEAVLSKRTAEGGDDEIRSWFCTFHADHLANLAMRGAERVRVYDGDGDAPVEFLGVEAATRRLALEKGIPLRQARRELERRRRKGQA